MPSPQRLLVNPAAAAGRALRLLRPLLAHGSWEVRATNSAQETHDEASRAVRDRLPRLLVAGGDGTLHHAIRALAGTDCALGIIPLGSGNDLARGLDLPLDPIRAGRHALDAPIRSIDLGRVDDRVFAGVLGLGFDGDVCDYLDRRRGLPLGRAAYPWAVLRTLRTFSPPRVRIEHDAGEYQGLVTLVGLANSPFFGGGMRIAPEARLDDGLLDLIIVERVSLATLISILPRVYRGGHLGHPAVQLLRVRGARLTSDSPRHLYADGERLHRVRPEGARIDVLPGALRVAA